MNNTAIIILAAGNSSRLGRPKQLLPFQGKNLLTHIVTEGTDAGLAPLVVVLGAFIEDITAALPAQGIEIAYHPNWQAGMASSIATGISALLSSHPASEAVIIAVCDQPYISAELLRQMIDERARSEKGIVACTYAGIIGTPVLFSRPYYMTLAALSGDGGAKKLLQQFKDDVAVISFPQGQLDIDTEEDYQMI
jgi:molybdenum cofactor cytidylyltransferase